MSVTMDSASSSAFQYQQADTWDEAVELLGLWGDEAKLIAGGQSLVPMLNLRLAAPGALIDINPIGPQEPWIDGDELVIPALTRHHQVLESALVRQFCPMLMHAVSLVGNVRVRNRGTIGGSVAHADPTGEIPCTVLASSGRIIVQGPSGPRSIAASDFFVTYLTTGANPDEVVTEIRIPTSTGQYVWGFDEVTRRYSDFATVSVAAISKKHADSEVAADDSRDGRHEGFRVILGGVADRPLSLGDEELEPFHLVGATREAIENVARNAAESISPESDVHASADYRRRLTRVLVQRTLLRVAGLK